MDGHEKNVQSSRNPLRPKKMGSRQGKNGCEEMLQRQWTRGLVRKLFWGCCRRELSCCCVGEFDCLARSSKNRLICHVRIWENVFLVHGKICCTIPTIQARYLKISVRTSAATSWTKHPIHYGKFAEAIDIQSNFWMSIRSLLWMPGRVLHQKQSNC